MSNQIETQIDVSLTERNRLTAFFRIILVVPAFIFVSSFAPSAAFSDDAFGLYAGLMGAACWFGNCCTSGVSKLCLGFQ
jgi:hypothetical protein